jgi:hypothetical protein
MKTLTKVILISMIFALPAYAQDKDKHAYTDDAEHESMDGMTNHQEMMPMHQHMLEMQDLMKTIKQEKDPKKRQELMQMMLEQMMEHDNMKMHGNK